LRKLKRKRARASRGPFVHSGECRHQPDDGIFGEKLRKMPRM
jgi:hypothetical protein